MKIGFLEVSKSFIQDNNAEIKVVQALLPLSLSVSEGEFICIIGPSGCGKSTLLNLLAGLEKPDTGRILVDGVTVNGPGSERILVFQEPGLMPWMTVAHNVEYGWKLQGVPAAERCERVKKYLKMVHLSQYAGTLPHQLSGGMKQRVSIARALALEPKVLLMDEPFSALDAQTRDILHDELQRIWQETGTTILFVTHNIREAVYLADRIVIMTAAPGSIKNVVHVPFAHPRKKSSTELSAFSAILHDEIKQEVDKVAAKELGREWLADNKPPIPGETSADVGAGI
ncbi:MAG: ABC transporter ATP-binding protein [Candidatus Sumerlaeota bacterium]|nr:ABC transporter ATP-binding protein [Candidatus Sumerlaeota bacterium]